MTEIGQDGSRGTAWLPGKALVVAGVVTLVVVAGLAVWFNSGGAQNRLDLQVFVGAVGSMLSGHGLYDFSIDDNGTPTRFLYPPFAAIIFVPLAWLPVGLVGVAWDLVQLALSGFLIWLIAGQAKAGRVGPVVMVLVWIASLASVPMLSGIRLGQIGVLLVALVAIDFLLVGPKWRGVLTGVAAAIKLVPLLFVPYFLVTRQWRAAAIAVGAFIGAGLIGFLVLPAESVRYWTQLAFNTERFPGIGSYRNKSLLGVLQYAGLESATVVWLVLSVVILAVALAVAVRHHRRGEEAAAMIVVGVASGAISPVSWGHHLVWLVLAVAYLVFAATGWWRVLGWVLFVAISPLAALVAQFGAFGEWLYLAVPLALSCGFIVFGLPRKAMLEASVA